MFLDKELFEICSNAKVVTPEDIQELNATITRKCEEYYKKKISPEMKRVEVKALLDRTFNLFDSFVNMLLDSTDTKLLILGGLFAKFTFKKQFFSNPKLKELYERL